MTTHKTTWWLVGLLCLALWPAHAFSQGGLWERYMDASLAAYQKANYAEAEKQVIAALGTSSKVRQDQTGGTPEFGRFRRPNPNVLRRRPIRC